VLGITVVSLTALYRTERAVRDELRAAESLSRLSLRFREDVHSSVAAQLDAADPPSLTLELPGGETIRYRAVAGGVERVKSKGDAVVHYDTFRFAGAYSAAWEIVPQGDRRLVVLSLASDRRMEPSTDRAVPVADRPVAYANEQPPLRIEALLGGAMNDGKLAQEGENR
jgi:hypothetical protein